MSCASGRTRQASPSATSQLALSLEYEITTWQARTSQPTETRPEVTRWRIDSRDDTLDRLSVPKDTRMRLVVIADVTDHVHLHGYDLMADVAPGSPAVLNFPADVSGRFEIELEDSGRQIAQLTVQP